nr:MAG TPA: hypothetical protein [Caudoviricetes sp.]
MDTMWKIDKRKARLRWAGFKGFRGFRGERFLRLTGPTGRRVLKFETVAQQPDPFSG